MKDLDRCLMDESFSQVVNRYVWQGSEYASKVGHKTTNKTTFESFCWTAVLLISISALLAEIDSDKAARWCLVRKLLYFLQNSSESTFTGVSFW